MADVESQVAETVVAEERSPGGEWGAPTSLRTAASTRTASRSSGITWWEACGGWKSRIALSM